LKLYENNEKKTVREYRYTRKIDENNEIKEKDIERVWESLILLIHCSINQRGGFSGCRSSLGPGIVPYTFLFYYFFLILV
jgi:hypothetical protein